MPDPVANKQAKIGLLVHKSRKKNTFFKKKVLGKILHIVFKWKHNGKNVFQIEHTPAA
jgi:hypothetical protein